MQNVRRLGQRNRLCNVLGRSITTINNTVDYMRSHLGECTITEAKIADFADSPGRWKATGARSAANPTPARLPIPP